MIDLPGEPSLSLCMLTRGPGTRLRALLELVRPAVDEIVVAIDERGGRDAVEACEGLADQTFLIEDGTPARRLGWLMHQCRCDWVLRLDDDEVPSSELLDRLPSLLRARWPVSIALSRRWLYLGGAQWIDAHPWTPDYQLRLVRNVPGVWSFPGLRHDNFDVVGQRRFVGAPIYHLDLLLHDVSRRRAKRERYEGDRPGHANQGFPVNAMYTPEDVPGLVTAPVSRADLDLIERVLDPPDTPRGSLAAPRAQPKRVPTRETERFFGAREVSPGAYAASLRLLRSPRRIPPGTVRLIETVVENRGDEWWPAGDDEPNVALGYRWLDRRGESLGEGPRTRFTELVPPGLSSRVFLVVESPAQSGAYTLEVDVVHEGVRWFGCAERVGVEVRP